MTIYDNENGGTYSLLEFIYLLVEKRLLITWDNVTVTRSISEPRNIWLIDGTNSAYEIDPEKYKVYE